MELLVGAFSGVALWMLDRFRDLHQGRRRVRVLVHPAFFMGEVGASVLTTPPEVLNYSVPVTGYGDPNAINLYYFIKVTNKSKRDIWITHVWFDADPPVDIVLPQRPLPARLTPDETWEGWVHAARLAHASNVEHLGRVLVANRKRSVKSRPNKNIPTTGYVAGAGSA